MLEEFNIAFWVMPTDLNPQSYFINLFERAYVWAESASTRLYYKFVTGSDVSNFIQPNNPALVSNQMIQLSNWNYVSISQRQVKTELNYYYQIQVGIV